MNTSPSFNRLSIKALLFGLALLLSAASLRAQKDTLDLGNGLKYVQWQAGSGPAAGPTAKVKVHYVAYRVDGTAFENSYDYGSPIGFRLGDHEVLPGWEVAIERMKVGEKGWLYVPSSMGYGQKGQKGYDDAYIVKPGEDLIYEIELVKAK